MKTFLRMFVLMLSIAAVASCKKDHVADPGQRPDFSNQWRPTPRAIIEVRNESLRDADTISAAFLVTSDTLGLIAPVAVSGKGEFTTGIHGTHLLNVIVEGIGENSVTVVDSNGQSHCKNVTTAGISFVRFENIHVSDSMKVVVTYRSTPCL